MPLNFYSTASSLSHTIYTIIFIAAQLILLQEVSITHIDTYVGNILNKPLKSHCSPWELHFLETSSYTACNYLVLRVSHAIGDGQILKSILEGLTDRIQTSSYISWFPVY